MSEKKVSVFLKIIQNKYLLISIIFIVWIFFFDEYSLVASRENRKELENLLKQQQYYTEKIKADQLKLNELNSGKEELEKYAREQFYMSKPDEDLYVIVRD